MSIPDQKAEQENTPPVPYSKTPESLLPLHMEKMRLTNATPKASNPQVNDSDSNMASRFTIKTDDENSHTQYTTPYVQRSAIYYNYYIIKYKDH